MGPDASPELGRSEATAQEARRAANRRKVREHRQRLRAMGMRPIQIWVPDVHAPGFEAEARRQSLLVAQSPEEAEIQAFIDSVYEWPDDEYSQ
ncbi:antitoxin MazE family protein [Microcystis elabens FACHB-917]|nr:antitoxin MazE family protein [Microcystis elabens FACHB-917]